MLDEAWRMLCETPLGYEFASFRYPGCAVGAMLSPPGRKHVVDESKHAYPLLRESMPPVISIQAYSIARRPRPI
jgi:hypothetical protein